MNFSLKILEKWHKNNYAFSMVRFYWRPNRKIRHPYTKPLNFNSGDLSDHIKEYSPDDFAPGFENLNELKNAPEPVKKIFSLKYQSKPQTLNKELEEVVSLIQEHPADLESIEVQIAKLTVYIRRGIKHCMIFRHDGYSKKSQQFRIDLRKKLLGELKLVDREKFDWLTKQLKIQYIDPPQSNSEKAEAAIDRSKRGLRRLAAKVQSDEAIRRKTELLREKLLAEREKFEAVKERELKEIEAAMADMKLIETPEDGTSPRLPDLLTALELLDHAHLIPKPEPELPEWLVIHRKKCQVFMPKKKVEDDKILRANGFLTDEDFPRYPDKDFY